MRFFNCYKSSQADRVIGDRRLRNWRKGKVPGASRFLPTALCLASLDIDPKAEQFSICIADRRDFYHQFSISDSRALSNFVWPPIRVEDLDGDRLASFGKTEDSTRVKEFLVCFGRIPQGDHVGVEFATEAHRNQSE